MLNIFKTSHKVKLFLSPLMLSKCHEANACTSQHSIMKKRTKCSLLLKFLGTKNRQGSVRIVRHAIFGLSRPPQPPFRG